MATLLLTALLALLLGTRTAQVRCRMGRLAAPPDGAFCACSSNRLHPRR
ncbi:hypothetical protein [Azospira sp. I13]|nr:hypothetical protein [Azospira sp. I13]